MLFNSLEFALFLPVVFVLYWINYRSITRQNILLLVASYIFYGWWDWRFLALLFISSSVDFVVGLRLQKEVEARERRKLVGISLLVNLGMLSFFKYFNFFVDSFIDAFGLLGISLHPVSLQIILPVGISFYTFQSLSYTLDVYRGKIEATNNPITYYTYVSFFPQLVAGPIERAVQLLPQVQEKRYFSYNQGADAMRQMLWGLFKKVVIADNCARIVDPVFASYQSHSSLILLFAAFFFAIQIYADFSGYTDIALGVARLFGFHLSRNFSYPYFSRDIAEFWRRWHISLTNWFRDYIYFPLGGSRVPKRQHIRNVFIVFLISGFWHGAKWTFIIWGLLHTFFYLVMILQNNTRKHTQIVAEGRLLPTWDEMMRILGTFTLVSIAWVFFRAQSISDALGYWYNMFSVSNLKFEAIGSSVLPFVVFLLGIEWIQREHEHGLAIDRWPSLLRWGMYFFVIFLIIVYGVFNEVAFIYHQF